MSNVFTFDKLPPIKSMVVVYLGSLLIACGGESSGKANQGSDLYAITLFHKENSIPTGSEIDLIAIGDFSDGSKEDITHLVDFEVADETVLAVSTNKKIKGIRAGNSLVVASLQGISESVLLSVTEAMCGGVIGDIDLQNSSGSCLKIIQGLSGEAKDKLFTSTPSLPFLTMLGYEEDDSADNQGRSYARTYQIGMGELAGETIELSPSGVAFGLFRQDGLNWESDSTSAGFGEGGQFDRYCADLASIKYSGRSDWRRPTSNELMAIYADHGPLWDSFGFPSTYVYWTSTPSSSDFLRVGFLNGEEHGTDPSASVAASCVSLI